MITEKYTKVNTESYIVKYWRKKQDGFVEQSNIRLYASDKQSHELVERYVIKKLKPLEIVSVTYE